MPVPIAVKARPDQVNLCLYAGDDFYLDLTVVNPDGTAPDLSGLVAMAEVRENTDAGEPVLATFTASIAANVVSLWMKGADTAVLPAAAVWDCQLTGTGTWTVAAGTVLTSSQVTT
jgi:hypothetical protein